MSKSADTGVQVPPFPLSTRNRTECPAATEIRTACRSCSGAHELIGQGFQDNGLKSVAERRTFNH